MGKIKENNQLELVFETDRYQNRQGSHWQLWNGNQFLDSFTTREEAIAFAKENGWLK